MLHLYNSLTRKKELFTLRGDERALFDEEHPRFDVVSIYSCGPTVYSFPHLGNMRSVICVDILRRWLEHLGFGVRQVMNITDVGHMTTDGEIGEDKIEAAAKREKISPRALTQKYTCAFFNDINTLGVEAAWKYPRASEHIKEITEMIQKLLDKDYAYKVDGTVYFDLSKFPKYGRLSGNTVSELIAGARVEVLPEKRQPYDFALWIENPKHLLQWKTPWGAQGYPGWHIECSTMAMKYLGETIDIHTGGEELKFPHHECEIAQSEGATGRRFVRYWFHVKHLLVNGEKMSKSKKNFFTVKDVLKKGYSARALRYLLLATHYRDTLNFTFDALKAAQSALERMDELWYKLYETSRSLNRLGKKAKGLFAGKKTVVSLKSLLLESREDFERAMNDDLDTPKALAVFFSFVRKANMALGQNVSASDLLLARRLMLSFARVLGLGLPFIKPPPTPKKVRELLSRREKARKEKDWKRADDARKKIETLGFAIDDTPLGPRVKRVKK